MQQFDGTSEAARRVWIVRCRGAASAIVVGLLVQIGHGLAADTPPGWLCVSDKAAGFSYDKKTKSWNPITFRTSDKYIVRKPSSNEMSLLQSVYGDALKPTSYVVVTLGESDPLLCDDIDKLTGVITCGGRFEQFAIEPHSLRMQRYYKAGYLSQYSEYNAKRKEDPDTPEIQIGRCSPL
jgi:hypothetical protein